MKATVLVVDDILTNVKLLEARLVSENFNVISSYNGADALAICQSQNIDVILSDVMMPQMDGFELCSRLKSKLETKDIPIIFLTGLEEESYKARAFQTGVDDFLTKPVNEITLQTRLKNLLIQKKLKDEVSRIEAAIHFESQIDGKARNSLDAKILKGQGRILLIDLCSRIVSKVLPILSEKHNIFVETSPTKALQTLNEHRFEVLIIHMCEDNKACLEFCSVLRSYENTSQLPILVILEADDNILSEALKAGVNDYVLNPINPYDLMARLNVHLANKRLQNHLDIISKKLPLKT